MAATEMAVSELGRPASNGQAVGKNNNPHAELKKIVLGVPGLPAAVRSAEISLRQERVLDRQLVCVFFRLPGCHYTFEIDPESNTVVHWEWQPT